MCILSKALKIRWIYLFFVIIFLFVGKNLWHATLKSKFIVNGARSEAIHFDLLCYLQIIQSVTCEIGYYLIRIIWSKCYLSFYLVQFLLFFLLFSLRLLSFELFRFMAIHRVNMSRSIWTFWANGKLFATEFS